MGAIAAPAGLKIDQNSIVSDAVFQSVSVPRILCARGQCLCASMPNLLSTLRILSSPQCRSRWGLVLILMVVVAVVETAFTALFYLFASMLAGLKDVAALPIARFFVLEGSNAGGRIDVSLLSKMLVAVVCLRAGLALYLSYSQAAVAAEDGAHLARKLLERYLNAPFLEIRERPSWYLVRNINNSVEAVFSGVALPIAIVLSESMVCLGIFAVLLAASPVASIAAALVTLALAAVVIKAMHPLQFGLGVRNQELVARQFGELAQAFGGLRETKVFAAESFFVERFRVLRSRITRNITQIAFFASLPKTLIETAFLLVTVLVVAWLLASRAVDASMLALLGLYAYAGLRLMPSAARVISCFNQIRLSQPALQEVAGDFARWAPAGADASIAARRRDWGELRLEAIGFSYPNHAEPALRDVSIAIKRGEAIGITGKSGAGKSTLIDLILGLVQPSKGRMTDEMGVKVEAGWLRQRVGYVPQQPILLDTSVRQNIAFGVPAAEIDDVRVRKASSMARIEEFVAALPEGFETGLGELGNRVSGGQRQRIAIARALYHQPEFLVFDEATSALDLGTEAEVVEVIEGLKGSVTMLIIAHRLNTIKHCDRILLMDAGTVIAQGDFAELSSHCVPFRALIELHELV